jgi:type IV pilus assembly protein PilM
MKQLGHVIEPAVEKLQALVKSVSGFDRMAGLDIDVHQIKLLVLRRKKGQFVLELAIIETLDASVRGDRERLAEHQRQILARIVKENKLEGVPIVANLPYYRHSTRLVLLPKMPKKELHQAITFETRKFTSLPMGEAMVEYVTVEEIEQEGARYGSHLVVESNKHDLKQMLNLLNGLGLKVIGMGVTPLALLNVVSRLENIEKNAGVAVLDVGGEEISLLLIRNGKLVFARDIPGSGDTLTETLTSIVVEGEHTIDLTFERAEEIKTEYGIIDSFDNDATTEEGIPLTKIAVMMRPVLERMLIEIRRSFDFCEDQFNLSAPDKMFLSGGGSKLKNFREFLSKRLHVDVEYLDPISNVTLGPAVDSEWVEQNRVSLISVLGFAMNVSGSGNYILPEEFRESNKPLARKVLVAASAVAVLGVLGSYLGTEFNHRQARDLLKKETQILFEQQSFEKLHQTEAAELKEHQFKRQALLRLLGPEVPWADVLKDLSHRLGPEVQLTDLELVTETVKGPPPIEFKRIRFHGLLYRETERLESLIAELVSGVNRSPFFEDVRLEKVMAIQNNLAVTDFSCRLVY